MRLMALLQARALVIIARDTSVIFDQALNEAEAMTASLRLMSAPAELAFDHAPQGDALRQLVADHIERMIQLLDALDGDPDMEPDGHDEPWLAGCSGDLHCVRSGGYSGDDLEDDVGDQGEDPRCCPPDTLNPPPVRAKRIRRAA